MLLEGCLVAGAAGVDDLDLPLADIGIVPVRLYADNLLVQLGANVPRRADDHALSENADELAHPRRAGFPCYHMSLLSTRSRSGAPYSAFITATACWIRSRWESSSPAVASSARSSITSGSTPAGRSSGISLLS